MGLPAGDRADRAHDRAVTQEISLEPEPTPLERVGLVCARATLVASVLGFVEGLVISKTTETSVAGLGLATAGLWWPLALASLGPAHALHRWPRAGVSTALLAAVLASALFARFSPFAAPLAAAPLEGAAALLLAWLAAGLHPGLQVRRPVALLGLLLAVGLQLFATRWVDAHRAFAGLLVDHSAAPRFMLRTVLRRFV